MKYPRATSFEVDANSTVAYEMLVHSIQMLEKSLAHVLASAAEHLDFERARQVMQIIEVLKRFQTEFANVLPLLHKLPNFTRYTHINAYRLPILQALEDGGGTLTIQEVLVSVEQQMRSTLQAVDYQILMDGAGLPRWSNYARWCRFDLVKDGLLAADSAIGIWAITEAGRRALRTGGKSETPVLSMIRSA